MRGAKPKQALSRDSKPQPGELVITGGMMLLAATIGAAFHLHLGLEVGPAIALSIVVGSMLTGMRALASHTTRVTSLGHEIQRLELDIEKLKGRHSGPGIEVRSQFSVRPQEGTPFGPEAKKEVVQVTAAKSSPGAEPSFKPLDQKTEINEANAVLRGAPAPAPLKDVWSFRPAQPRFEAAPGTNMKVPAPAGSPPPEASASAMMAAEQRKPAGSKSAGEQSAAIPAESLREADVEMIQGLIKKLADDVNAADILRRVPANPAAGAAMETNPHAAAMVREGIDHSVGALKRVAGAMAAPPQVPEGGYSPSAAADPETIAVSSMRGPIAPESMGPPVILAPAVAAAGPATYVAPEPPRSEFAAAIASGRIDVLLEPIIGLGDLRPRHYEVSLRLSDENGDAVEAGPGNPHFATSGLLPLLDRARLDRTVDVAGRLDKRGKTGAVISEYSRDSLTDREFLLGAKSCSDQHPGVTGQLVLSFAQSSLRHLSETQWAALAALRSIGFRFSIQDITDLDMDFARLADAGFAFAKLDADVFLEGLRAPHGTIPASDICRFFASLGLTLIVGRIDDEGERARLFGFGVIFGQGQLFGGARPMKVDSIARTEHRAA